MRFFQVTFFGGQRKLHFFKVTFFVERKPVQTSKLANILRYRKPAIQGVHKKQFYNQSTTVNPYLD